MRKLLFLSGFISLFAFSCKKEKGQLLSGTLVQKGGCYSDSWLLEIDNPNPTLHSFICDDAPPMAGPPSGYNCSNSVFIRLANFEPTAAAGQKVSFRFRQDEGILCLSYSYGTHHIKVTDLVFQ